MEPASTSSLPFIQSSRQVAALAAEYNLLADGDLGLRQRPCSDSLADPARNLLFHPTPVQERQPFNRRFFLKSPRAFAKISKGKRRSPNATGSECSGRKPIDREVCHAPAEIPTIAPLRDSGITRAVVGRLRRTHGPRAIHARANQPGPDESSGSRRQCHEQPHS